MCREFGKVKDFSMTLFSPLCEGKSEERMLPPTLLFPHCKWETESRHGYSPSPLCSFHLSQPFSLSYRSILPTSLIYVMLFRLQRLLTLRTWCGYRYEMAWKWLQQHIIFQGVIGTHRCRTQVTVKHTRSFPPMHLFLRLKKVVKNSNLLLKQDNGACFSKQIKLDSHWVRRKEKLLSPPFFFCFYTEKKTLNWIPITFIMFIQVTFTYPVLWKCERKILLPPPHTPNRHVQEF